MPTLKPVLVAVGLAAGTLVVSGAPADAATFANCTAMHRTFKHGVAKSDAAAARQVRQGYGRPAVRPKVYWSNRRSDRDGDGTACEA